MKEYKITYFFDEVHYVRRFIHIESQERQRRWYEVNEINI